MPVHRLFPLGLSLGRLGRLLGGLARGRVRLDLPGFAENGLIALGEFLGLCQANTNDAHEQTLQN